ncbi:MAG TPA: SIR2 family protein, partial [Blastocatellia bacterium]|nr:SIR2 family protein [Blastocatellia bacterium]
NPTAEKPLLYNLFGSIDNQQSLIFTHDDLIQYMLSIIREFKLPQNLRSLLEDSVYFIFLGFDFEKWYLKLLLKLFLDENKLSIASEVGAGTQDRLRTFYAGNYGLEFVDDKIDEYIKRLYDECERQNLLRPIRLKAQVSIQDEIRGLIKKDEVREAQSRLYQFLEGLDDQAFETKAEERQDLLNELDEHAAQLSRIEKKLRQGKTTEEAANVEKNRIIDAVQTIAGIFA